MRRWENELSLDQLQPGVTPAWGPWTLRGEAPDLSDCIAGRLPEARHLLAIWEPLNTKAPSPSRCQPFCCYAKSVIFYHRPYIVRGGHPWRSKSRWHWERSGGFVQFDQIDTRLTNDTVVSFDGDEWQIGGGSVQWHHGRWWMHRWARRSQPREAVA